MDKKIKNKILIHGLILISSFFVFLIFTPRAEAAGCGCDCQCIGTVAGGCAGAMGGVPSAPFVHSSCAINPGSGDTGWVCGPGCPANSKCNTDKCPAGANNGDPCSIWEATWNWGCGCQQTDGKWDAIDPVGSKCVKCSGKTESINLGNTTSIFSGTTPGDGKCESACGASTECDDRAFNIVGFVVLGGTCDNCVFNVTPPPPPSCGNSIIEPALGEQCDPGFLPDVCPGLGLGPCQVANCQCASLLGNCEDDCTCPCPAECSCSMSDCQGGLVPCGRTCNDPCTKTCECCRCTLCHVFVLLKRIIDFFTLYILLPLGVLMFVVGGGMLLISTGNPNRVSSGKKIITSAIIGILIVSLSWLIINTVIVFATTGHLPAPGEIGTIFSRKWNEINCPVSEETVVCVGAYNRGLACSEDSQCCSNECTAACSDSSLSLPSGSPCYLGEECLSGGCIDLFVGPMPPGVPVPPGRCE